MNTLVGNNMKTIGNTVIVLLAILTFTGCKKDNPEDYTCVPSQTIEVKSGIQAITTYDDRGREKHFSREASKTSIPAVERDYYYGNDGLLEKTVEYSNVPIGLDYHLLYDTTIQVYTHNASGKVATINTLHFDDRGNGDMWIYKTKETYDYDAQGNLIRLSTLDTIYRTDDTVYLQSKIEYMFDNSNNITQVYGGKEGLKRYKNTYDEKGYLVEVTEKVFPYSIYLHKYYYDERGNRIKEENYDEMQNRLNSVRELTYDNSNRLLYEETKGAFGIDAYQTIQYFYNCP